MKFCKIISFFIAILMVVTLFSGCKKKSPALTETPDDIKETEIVFSNTIEKTDVEGVYNLGSEISASSENLKIATGSQTAYICIKESEYLEVIHFSVFENKSLATTKINGENFCYGVLEKDDFYAVELSSATLFVYSKEGTLKSETKIEEEGLVFAFLEKSGENLIYRKTSGDRLYKLNLKTNEKSETKEGFAFEDNASFDQDNVYIKETNGKSFCVSFKDLTVTRTRTENFREFLGPLGIAYEKGYFTLAFLNTGKEKIMVEKLSEEEKIICANETGFITTADKTQKYFRFYDYVNNKVTDKIGGEGEKLLDAQILGSNFVFAAIREKETGKNIYRLLKISEYAKPTATVSNKLFDAAIYKETFGNKESEDTLTFDNLAEETGIRLLYGKMGSDFKTDFSYSLASKGEAEKHLEQAKKVFSTIPKELLMEITNDREIWVYLCKGLNTNGTEYTNRAGLTKLYNHNVIFIDIGCEDFLFSERLCHGIAHIIDDYMPESALSGFGEITPEKIKKSGNNDKHTQSDSEDEVWFYNKYCKLSDKEDRVITLGEMFNAIIVSAPGEAFIAENVKKKASFMAKAMEESFDFSKANRGEPWEMYLLD